MPREATQQAGHVATVSTQPAASDSIEVHLGEPTVAGLAVSVSFNGDPDGETILSNQRCCGIADVRAVIKDVRVQSESDPLPADRTSAGWVVRHEPSELLTVTYRLPATGPMTIDSGTADQVKPIVGDDFFHLMGSTALLLPRGRPQEEMVVFSLSAKGITGSEAFVSSFGPGDIETPLIVPRGQITRALYLGGRISLDLIETSEGVVGIAHSAMDRGFQAGEMHDDALKIIESERKFFRVGQPWYLVSVHGGERISPDVNVGGGMGLTDSFAMFVRSDLDFSDAEHREHFRWVLAHEYFHHWIGLTLRIAPLEGSTRDDASNYWFTEGFTEFFAMRLLTRQGLQTPERSLEVMNHKLARYATNSKRNLGAREVGALFWSDHDAQQIPYLRGYLAAWFIEMELPSNAGARPYLDTLIRDLVGRALRDPALRVDTDFLVDYLGSGLSPSAFETLRDFIVDGGAAPFSGDSFAPCLAGQLKGASGSEMLQFGFVEGQAEACYSH